MQQQLEGLEHKIWQKTSEYNEKSESTFTKSLEYGQIIMYVLEITALFPGAFTMGAYCTFLVIPCTGNGTQ